MSNKKYVLALLGLCVLIISICFFENTKKITTQEDVVEVPIFSCTSGFYDNEFYLEITSESSTTVYYTLDGSIPDESSLQYKSAILIDDATNHENYYSMITDVSAGFNTDLLSYYDVLEQPQDMLHRTI